METLSSVVLVDAEDRPLGQLDKLEAHRSGALHRAFSVFVFDGAGRTLLQRRAADKYHSGGLWSNACCSHPRAGTDTDLPTQARARLRQEMGLDCALRPLGTVRYRQDVGAGLVEHELDHVLAGHCEARPQPDAAEVMDWRWLAWADFLAELRASPDRFTAWLGPILERLGPALGRFAADAARPPT